MTSETNGMQWNGIIKTQFPCIMVQHEHWAISPYQDKEEQEIDEGR